MRSESNEIPQQRVFTRENRRQTEQRVLAVGLAAAAIALNRAEDELPAGAELALCFVSLPAEVPEWIELVPAGAIAGADGRAFLNDRPDDFVKVSQQLKRIRAGWCIDLDHQLQFAANEKVGGTAPASGWIVELENRDGAIWGKVEWTDLGTVAIQSKRYRGLSPVFAYDKRTKRAIGLVSAALTNNPNLDLVALNAARNASNQENDSMDWLKKALGLADDATDEAVKAALNSFIALAGVLATALGMDAKAAVALNAETLSAALTRKFGKPSDVLVALCTKAAVKTDAAADAILAGLEKVLVDPAKFVPMEAHMALKDELTALNAGKPGELVEQALKDGRLLPRQKAWALNYAQRDLEGFKTYIGAAPEHLAPVNPPADKAVNASDAKSVAKAAQLHIAEQSKLGNIVSAAQAVAHVTSKRN